MRFSLLFAFGEEEGGKQVTLPKYSPCVGFFFVSLLLNPFRPLFLDAFEQLKPLLSASGFSIGGRREHVEAVNKTQEKDQ